MVDIQDKLKKEDKKNKSKAIQNILENCLSPEPGKPRPHLGMSQIGDDCKRKLFYSFRWFLNEIEPRVRRIFEDGNIFEREALKMMADNPFKVWATKPDGTQFRAISSLNKHFQGSIDAVFKGIPGDPETPYLGEYKTYNKTRFNKLEKDGVKKNDPKYYAQIMCYLVEMKLKKCLFIAKCKDDARIYHEILTDDEAYIMHEALEARAGQIVEGKITDFDRFEATDFRCKMCSYKNICHKNKEPEKNCRTCIYSEALEDGTWICNFNYEGGGTNAYVMNYDRQLLACDHYSCITD
jgi:hypothetical protein